MNKRQRSQYRMLVRVRDFGNMHKEQFPEESEGYTAFAAVTAAVASIEALSPSKQTGRRTSKVERLAAKRVLVARIGVIARSARVMGRATPGADAKFPPIMRWDDVSVLERGRLFLQEAAPVKNSFIRCGLPASFVDDLSQAVATFEQTIAGRSAGKTSAIVSRKAITAAITKSVRVVQSLDVLVANVLGHDELLMNSWKQDRHVEFVGKSTPPVATEASPVAPSAADEPLRRAS